MKLQLKSIIRIAGLLPLVAAHDAAAQRAGASAIGVEPDKVLVLQSGALAPASGVVNVISGEARVVGEVVTGKPYSADSITETIQTLADGNRIVSTNTSRIYRDSEGRTRQEQTLTRLGSWAAGEQPVTLVTIDDPVAKVSWFLDPERRTARELRPYRFEAVMQNAEASEGGVITNDIVVHRLAPEAGTAPAPAAGFRPAVPIVTAPTVQSFQIGAAPPIDVRTQDLGEQMLQGVRARGTRETQTIAAGAIGNEWPIEIVTETWYSDELEALMSRRTSDPRFGETIYRLANVVLDEPPAELFEVPQDYEIESGPSAPVPAFGIATPGERVDVRILRREND
jgi:hypothetical protein